MQNIKVYISGAVSGTDDYMQRFEAAETYINAHVGYTAINPTKATAGMPAETSWEEYMGVALKLLATSDAIYLLSGWENSRGAKIEREVAILMDKHIFMEKTL